MQTKISSLYGKIAFDVSDVARPAPCCDTDRGVRIADMHQSDLVIFVCLLDFIGPSGQCRVTVFGSKYNWPVILNQPQIGTR